MLKVYYKHTMQAPFRESEWARVRELFFDHFVPKKAEALVIKEESPLEYMPRSSIGLQAFVYMTSQNSPSGLREGVIFTGCWSREAKSRSAPI